MSDVTPAQAGAYHEMISHHRSNVPPSLREMDPGLRRDDIGGGREL